MFTSQIFLNDLVMKIMQNLLFIIHMFHALILCIENMFDTQIYKKMWNLRDIHSFISSYFIHQNNYPCVKHVFNAWYSCVKCTNLWMNEFHTIFIVNSSHVKFVKYLLLWFVHWGLKCLCQFTTKTQHLCNHFQGVLLWLLLKENLN